LSLITKQMTSYLNNPVVLEGKDINDIAKFTRIKPLNKMLQPSVPLKKAYGYQNPRMYPKVSGVIGSAMYPNIGTSRAVGPMRFGGNSAYYSYGGRPQAPLYRNKDIRLQFPHLQREVADVIQVPPKMYGEFTPKCSLNLVL
jgi:hypothetical protein